jgi:hypothetical protein
MPKGIRGVAVNNRTYELARMRDDRDALIVLARQHMEAYRREPWQVTKTVAQRMHLGLARHRVFVARRLNRRLVAYRRETAAADGGPNS